MLELDAVPRIGENVLVKINDDHTIEGVVDSVHHWIFVENPTDTQVTVYLRPSTYK
ncbi:hypothetical protein QFL75_002756 [Acinetobacter baumannii]|nr:hypothetical protein [Acinetobacter baumannii]